MWCLYREAHQPQPLCCTIIAGRRFPFRARGGRDAPGVSPVETHSGSHTQGMKRAGKPRDSRTRLALPALPVFSAFSGRRDLADRLAGIHPVDCYSDLGCFSGFSSSSLPAAKNAAPNFRGSTLLISTLSKPGVSTDRIPHDSA